MHPCYSYEIMLSQQAAAAAAAGRKKKGEMSLDDMYHEGESDLMA